MDLSERGAGEARHPWELVRAQFFRDLIQSHVDLSRLSDLVDVGAGDGWFAQELLPMLPLSATVTCWDINYSSEDLAAALPERVIRTTTRPLDTSSSPIDGSEHGRLVTLLDVLEHIPDDRGFLRDELVPLVGDNGTLIISVPAHPQLFSDHDTALGHERRYKRNELLARVSENFNVIESGPLFTSLLAPRAIQVLLERLGRDSGEQGIGGWDHGKFVTNSVRGALALDARLGRWSARHHIKIPGLSVWAVCRPLGAA
ncbi:MAG: hypothetical protein JHD40_04620 [Acidimicrobiia bacterium]|nr:hypothetical protein [Acidimicrobiia bacterium]